MPGTDDGGAARDGAGVYTDTHAHLEYVRARLGDETLGRILAVYEEAGRGTAEPPFILDAGVEAGDFPGRLARYGAIPAVLLAAGLWPGRGALSDVAGALERLSEHAAHPSCRAVGECGLDYHHMEGDRRAQYLLFEGQLSLAARLSKPVVVHSRDAAADTLAILRARDPVPSVVLHCYGYGAEEIPEFLDAGCCISFAGNLTYRRADALRAACRIVPADRILLETDAPYMAPEPRRGKPCTSLDIPRTFAAAAKERRTSPGDLARTVAGNARRVFIP